MEIQLPHSKRRKAIGILIATWSVPLIVGVVWGVMFWQDVGSGPYTGHALSTAGQIVLVVVGGFALCGIMIYQAHVMGWYRATFVVSNETIKWSLPTGYCLSRKWSDLTYVLPTRNLLIFADGSTIPLRFGPTSFGEIPRGDMLSLFSICGESSLVAQAYLESKFFAPAKRSRFDFVKLLFVSFGFCTSLMAIILYLALQETKPTLLQIGVLWCCSSLPFFSLQFCIQ